MELSGVEQGRMSPTSNGILRVLRDDGSLARDASMPVEVRVAVYKSIVRATMVEERLGGLAREGAIAFHPPARRATPSVVAATAALGGWVFPASTELGAFLHRGVSIARYFDHVFGNAADATAGHSMPGYFTAEAERIAAVAAPTHGHLTHAVGFAWASMLRADDRAPVIAFADETAVDSAEFHNAANFAGVLKAPVVFAIRSTGTRDVDVADHAIAYGIEGRRVDGGDLIAVYEATRHAVDAKRPAILEVLLGENDGTAVLASHLGRERAWDPSAEAQLRSETTREIDDAVRSASEKERPALSSIGEHLFR
jgi:pyruvate dehydrogenase E1 component alpha subunit